MLDRTGTRVYMPEIELLRYFYPHAHIDAPLSPTPTQTHTCEEQR